MSGPKRFDLLRGCLLIAAIMSTPSGLAAQKPSPWDLAVSVGAFGGQFQFADSTHLARQEMFGGSAAIDFGRGVSLRGYYWQGANEDLDGTDPIFGYGGEIQFDVHLFSAIKPFFLGGIGIMDFDSSYVDQLDRPLAETTTYTLGGGVALDLARWFRLDVTARNYMFQGPEREGAETSDAWHSNFLLTGGVTVTVGRRRNVPSAASILSGEAAPVPGEYAGSETVLAGAQPGIIMVPISAVEQDPLKVAATADSLAIAKSPPLADDAVRSILATEIGYLDALFPSLASLGEERLPISGEEADTLRFRLARRMHETFEYLATTESAGVLAALDTQLDAYNITLDAKDEILAAAEETLNQRVRLMEAEGRQLVAQLDSAQTWERAEGARRRRLSGAGGGSFGNGTQLLVGGQMGLAAPWSPSFSIVPEVALGFFGGATSALVQGSVRYFHPGEGIEPFAGLGLGVLILSGELGDRSGTNLVVTPILGVEVPAPDMGDVFGSKLKGYFVEYQGVGFFDSHRLVFGLNWDI